MIQQATRTLHALVASIAICMLAQLSYDVDEGLPTDCCIAIGNFNSPGIIQQNYISQSIHTCMGC
jgi:hypothetical protein